MRAVHIEKKDRNAILEAAQTLRARLGGHEGRALRAAEASTLSGLPLDMAETALLALYTEYPSTMKVGDDGMFVVNFLSLSKRRDRGTTRRLWSKLKARLIKARHAFEDYILLLFVPALILSVAFNIAGLVTPLGLDFPGVTFLRFFPGFFIVLGAFLLAIVGLITFAFLVVVLAILLLFSVQLFLIVGSIYSWVTGGAEMGLIIFMLVLGVGGALYTKKLVLLGIEQLGALSARSNEEAWVPSLWNVLRRFWFGPRNAQDSEARDGLKDERELISLIAAMHGKLVVGDLVAAFAWDIDRADMELNRILLDYGGDIEVTEDGQFVYMFSAWAQKVDIASPDRPLPAWEKMPAIPRYWDLERKIALRILGLMFAGFAGVLTATFMFAHGRLGHVGRTLETCVLALGPYPYLCFALVMSLRLLMWLRARNSVFRERKTREDLKRIFEEIDGGWHIDTQFASRYGGQLDESQGTRNGAFFFRFPALHIEQSRLVNAPLMAASGPGD